MKSRIFYEEFDSFYYYSGSTQNWNMQGFHFHKNYEIILVMSDGAGICIGNREYEVEKGTLFVINNREYHKTSGVKGQDYNRYVVMFDPDRLRAVSQAMDYDFFKYFEHRPEGFIHRLYLNKEHLGEVIGLFEKVEKCSVSTEQGMDGVVLNLAIMELLVYINRLYDFFSEKSIDDAEMAAFAGGSGPVHDRDRIELIKKYIAAHVEDKLDLDGIAEQFYMNKYYLSHYFKKETGFTISQYITNLKITAAKGMLRNGFSVTETAVALSYNSDSHFINTFKKNTGTTPKKYANEKQ